MIFNHRMSNVVLEAKGDKTKSINVNPNNDDVEDYSKDDNDKNSVKSESDDDDGSDDVNDYTESEEELSTDYDSESNTDDETESSNDSSDEADDYTTDSEDETNNDTDDDTSNDSSDEANDYTTDSEDETNNDTDDDSDTSLNDNNSNTDDSKNDQKNYSLLDDLFSLRELIVNLNEQLASIDKSTIEETSIITNVSKNLSMLSKEVYNYIVNKFNTQTYVLNLYFYTYSVEALNVNISMLKKLNSFSENK